MPGDPLLMLDSLRQYKADVFAALGHPSRVAIVENLKTGEMTVGQLCAAIGVEQSNASQHLSVLRNKHIVQTRKHGNQIYYRLRDPVFGRLLDALRGFFVAHMTEALQLVRDEQAATEPDRGKRPHARAAAKVRARR
jgi:ArsR family transcriptional regulator